MVTIFTRIVNSKYTISYLIGVRCSVLKSIDNRSRAALDNRKRRGVCQYQVYDNSYLMISMSKTLKKYFFVSLLSDRI